MKQFHLIEHPLLAQKVAMLRDAKTPSGKFRSLVRDIALMLAFEAARSWPSEHCDVESPLGAASGLRLTRPVSLIPILRAGLGLSAALEEYFENSSVGHIGLYRDPATLEPVEYYCKLPKNLPESNVLLLDPMLATGGSAADAMKLLKSHGAHRIQFLCLIASRPGVEFVCSRHPDVEIYGAALDPELNEHGYIVPGLGDAGDRIFGTL